LVIESTFWHFFKTSSRSKLSIKTFACKQQQQQT